MSCNLVFLILKSQGVVSNRRVYVKSHSSEGQWGCSYRRSSSHSSNKLIVFKCVPPVNQNELLRRECELSRRERNAPLQVTDNKENNSGAARPLRFSACVWRDLKSLMSSCLCFEMDRTLISLGFLISSRISQANSFALSIWMRAISSLDGIFRSRHRTSLFSVHLADPPFCLIACRRSRTSHT